MLDYVADAEKGAGSDGGLSVTGNRFMIGFCMVRLLSCEGVKCVPPLSGTDGVDTRGSWCAAGVEGASG